jgi:hypothetical protein
MAESSNDEVPESRLVVAARAMTGLGALISIALVGFYIARGSGSQLMFGLVVASGTMFIAGLGILTETRRLDRFGKDARGLVVIASVALMLAVGARIDPGTTRLVDRVLVWSFVVFVVGLSELFVLFVIAAIRGRVDLVQVFMDKVPGEPTATTVGAPAELPQISLSRLQVFLWTLIVMIVYFHRVVTNVAAKINELPTIPPELLMVMGISSAVYLTGKGLDARPTPSPAAKGDKKETE